MKIYCRLFFVPWQAFLCTNRILNELYWICINERCLSYVYYALYVTVSQLIFNLSSAYACNARYMGLCNDDAMPFFITCRYANVWLECIIWGVEDICCCLASTTLCMWCRYLSMLPSMAVNTFVFFYHAGFTQPQKKWIQYPKEEIIYCRAWRYSEVGIIRNWNISAPYTSCHKIIFIILIAYCVDVFSY